MSLVLGHLGPSQPGSLQGEALDIALGSLASACGQQSVPRGWDRSTMLLRDLQLAGQEAGPGLFKLCHRVLGAPSSHLQALWFSQPPVSSDGITDHRGATFPKFLFVGEKQLPRHDPGGRGFSLTLWLGLIQGTQNQAKRAGVSHAYLVYYNHLRGLLV